jgi:hypothetical protein
MRKICTKGTASEAAEKSDRAGKHAPGAKAHDDYIAFAPGINPRPTLKPSFSAACFSRAPEFLHFREGG